MKRQVPGSKEGKMGVEFLYKTDVQKKPVPGMGENKTYPLSG